MISFTSIFFSTYAGTLTSGYNRNHNRPEPTLSLSSFTNAFWLHRYNIHKKTGTLVTNSLGCARFARCLSRSCDWNLGLIVSHRHKSEALSHCYICPVERASLQYKESIGFVSKPHVQRLYLISVCPPALRARVTSSLPYFSSASALCGVRTETHLRKE